MKGPSGLCQIVRDGTSEGDDNLKSTNYGLRLIANCKLFIKFMAKKVFVSGCYDLLHSGHVEFFQQASRYGDLYVGIGSDATYLEYKHRKPMFPQEERLFMVKNIKAVKDAYINEGSGVIDFLPTLDKVKPDVFVVNVKVV